MDMKNETDAFAVKLVLRDTPHSLVMLKETCSLQEKLVATSRQ